MFECSAILQVLSRIRMIDEMEYQKHYERLEEFSTMFSSLIKSFDDKLFEADVES
ncbi:MAG: hypothetical protein EOP06_00590 [Proteobacteria bacterium]|nr:MAG: hypothetical protein EOP06_00590 [Pseudomonadota bacterium]